eukprot:6189165-Pleurochrysis_carterae.AAC.2
MAGPRERCTLSSSLGLVEEGKPGAMRRVMKGADWPLHGLPCPCQPSKFATTEGHLVSQKE